jgi:hypothetical protein
MTLVQHWRLKADLQDIVFFLGVPLLLCVCMTAAGPYAAQIGPGAAFAYVAMLSFVPWWIAGLTTQLVHRCWSERLPLWSVAAIGAVAAGPLVLAYACGMYVFAETWWPALQSVGRLNGMERWQAFALSEGRSIMLWVAFVTIFRETFGWRRYGAAVPAVPGVASRFQLSGSYWTDADDACLQVLVAEGLPPRDIAAQLQRTYGAVRARTTKLGLKNNSRRA